jgi:hypothetical protein
MWARGSFSLLRFSLIAEKICLIDRKKFPAPQLATMLSCERAAP